MQPVLTPASDAQFSDSNSAMAGWALVLVIAVVSFVVHLYPDHGVAIEQAAEGLLIVGAAVMLVHGLALRVARGSAATQAADAMQAGCGQPPSLSLSSPHCV